MLNLIRDGIDTTILRHNRIHYLDILRSISEKGDVVMQETCILALGQFAAYAYNCSFRDDIDIADLVLATSKAKKKSILSYCG